MVAVLKGCGGWCAMGFALPKAVTASKDMILAVMPGSAAGVCCPAPSPNTICAKLGLRKC